MYKVPGIIPVSSTYRSQFHFQEQRKNEVKATEKNESTSFADILKAKMENRP